MIFFIFWPLPEKLFDCPKKNYFARLWGLQPPEPPSQLIRQCVARQPISCYYYACDFSYFEVVLCPSSLSQIMTTNAQIPFSRGSPDPLNARSRRLLGFPKSPTFIKKPRSAADHSADADCRSCVGYCPPMTFFDCTADLVAQLNGNATD